MRPPAAPLAARPVALASLAGATLCYGTVPIFLRYFTDYLDPWTVNGARYATAALFWAPFLFALRRRALREGHAVDRVWRDALPPTAFNLAAQILWAICPYYLEAPVIGFASRLSFLAAVALGFALVPDERRLARRPSFYAGSAACLAGVVMLFGERLGASDAAGAASPTGVSVMIGAALFLGAYTVAVRRWMRPYPTRLSFGVISLYTAAPLIVLAFVFGEPGDLRGLPPRVTGLLVASALVGIAFSHVLYYRGIQRLGPVVAAGMLMAVPFVTLAGAWWLLGESLTGWQLAGGVVIVGGGLALLRAQASAERVALRAGVPPEPGPQGR